MYHIDLNKPASVYFAGIGGISMSGLAEILMGRGFTVYGSDMKESDLTRQLQEKGAHISYDQSGAAIPDGIDVYIYTAAIHPDNPEYAAAIRKGISLMSRAQLVGQLMYSYHTSVAISGTHGKTTTTSMLSDILLEAGTDPTLSIGGILPSIASNIRVGGPDIFVTEACEYTDSFLEFHPDLAAILNVEADHLDYFSDLEAIVRSFCRFAEQVSPEGVLVLNGDMPETQRIMSHCDCRVVTVGTGPRCEYSYQDLETDDRGCVSFTICRNSVKAQRVSLRLRGLHNVMNALMAIAMADCLEVPRDISLRALSRFTGAHRRFEEKGFFIPDSVEKNEGSTPKAGASSPAQADSVMVIDDYAHHPTEISSSLQAAADIPHKDLWVVFQPHTYSRTKALLQDFALALLPADHVVIMKIYAARETDDLGISGATLASEIERSGGHACYFSDFNQAEDYLKKNCHPMDMVITMGAGDVYKLGESLISK